MSRLAAYRRWQYAHGVAEGLTEVRCIFKATLAGDLLDGQLLLFQKLFRFSTLLPEVSFIATFMASYL